MNLSTKQKQTHRQSTDVVTNVEGCGGGTDWEFGFSRCKPLLIEWIKNMVLMYSTRNSVQYPGINHSGKEDKKECVCD